MSSGSDRQPRQSRLIHSRLSRTYIKRVGIEALLGVWGGYLKVSYDVSYRISPVFEHLTPYGDYKRQKTGSKTSYVTFVRFGRKFFQLGAGL